MTASPILTSDGLALVNNGSLPAFTLQASDGSLTSSTITVTPTVKAANDAPTGSVSISGTAAEDQTLTASNTLADADGLGTISYQWNRAGSAIDGATASTYTLIQADVGSAITVTASYTDDQGTAESVTSSVTSAVANINDTPTGVRGSPEWQVSLPSFWSSVEVWGLSLWQHSCRWLDLASLPFISCSW